MCVCLCTCMCVLEKDKLVSQCGPYIQSGQRFLTKHASLKLNFRTVLSLRCCLHPTVSDTSASLFQLYFPLLACPFGSSFLLIAHIHSFFQHLFPIHLLRARGRAVGSRPIVQSANPWDVGSWSVVQHQPTRQAACDSGILAFSCPLFLLSAMLSGERFPSPSPCSTRTMDSILSGRQLFSLWGFWTSIVWLSEL